jgi:hypothetical protein
MKTSEFVKEYIGTLEHFIEQSGWPIRVDQQEAVALSKVIPALTLKDGLLSMNPKKKFPDNILAEFWKLKYGEALAESNKLYRLIEDAHRGANN